MPIYWAILTYMLLKPGTENHEYWFMFNGIDKVLHLSIFALLGFCFMTAFHKTRFLTYIYIMLIYAFLTEILQGEMKLGRSLEVMDVVADAVGFLMGYIGFRKAKQRF
ncbi:MAG: VanZ family protein [Bergeyella sp.]